MLQLNDSIEYQDEYIKVVRYNNRRCLYATREGYGLGCIASSSQLNLDPKSWGRSALKSVIRRRERKTRHIEYHLRNNMIECDNLRRLISNN